MIRNPHPRQRVVLHYNKRAAPSMPYHGHRGIVARVGIGPGPRNVGVVLDCGVKLVVLRGNLKEEVNS